VIIKFRVLMEIHLRAWLILLKICIVKEKFMQPLLLFIIIPSLQRKIYGCKLILLLFFYFFYCLVN